MTLAEMITEAQKVYGSRFVRIEHGSDEEDLEASVEGANIKVVAKVYESDPEGSVTDRIQQLLAAFTRGNAKIAAIKFDLSFEADPEESK